MEEHLDGLSLLFFNLMSTLNNCRDFWNCTGSLQKVFWARKFQSKWRGCIYIRDTFWLASSFTCRFLAMVSAHLSSETCRKGSLLKTEIYTSWNVFNIVTWMASKPAVNAASSIWAFQKSVYLSYWSCKFWDHLNFRHIYCSTLLSLKLFSLAADSSPFRDASSATLLSMDLSTNIYSKRWDATISTSQAKERREKGGKLEKYKGSIHFPAMRGFDPLFELQIFLQIFVQLWGKPVQISRVCTI